MEPRLKNSKKWTQFPHEYEMQILKTLKKAFPLQAQKGSFKVEGQIFSSEILLRLGFLEKGMISPINAESSIEYNSKKENVKKIIDLAIDTCASLLDNYFSDPKGDYPYLWAKYDIDKKDVYLKISKVNPDLEEQADALLGSTKDALVLGEDHEEEIDALKSILKED